MTAVELLATWREAGVRVWRDDDRVRFRARRGVMTPAWRAALRTHKADLLEVLRAEEAAWRALPRYPAEFAAAAVMEHCTDCGRPVLQGLGCCYDCLLRRDAAEPAMEVA